MKKILLIFAAFLTVATLSGCTKCGGDSEEAAAPEAAQEAAPAGEEPAMGEEAVDASGAPAEGEAPTEAAPTEGEAPAEVTE